MQCCFNVPCSLWTRHHDIKEVKFSTKGGVCDKIAVEWSNKAASAYLKTAFVYNFTVNVLRRIVALQKWSAS